MEGLLVVIAIATWVVSAIGKHTRQAQRRQNQGASGARKRPEPPAPPREERVEPKPVDLLSGLAQGASTWSREGDGYVPPQTQFVWEGEDPCHDEMFPRVRATEPSAPKSQQTAPASIPGLDITLDRDSMVKGIIYSEILTRRNVRRRPT